MSNLRSLSLAAGAVLCGASLLASPARAAFMAVSNIGGNVNYASLTDAAGTTYAAGTTAAYASPAGAISFSSDVNDLERNNQNSYNDNNFASAAQFINQCGYSGLFSCNASGAVTISFANPTTGFTVSADDFDTTAPYTFTAAVYDGATLLGTVTANSLADSGASPAVLAALSDTPITSVRVTDPTGNFALANVGVVPEPASLALLGTGLLGLLGMRRRRRLS